LHKRMVEFSGHNSEVQAIVVIISSNAYREFFLIHQASPRERLIALLGF
jgi:hypothetical protein